VIFLFAQMAQPYLEKLNWHLGLPLAVLILLPLVLAVAWLSYVTIERPWLLMRRKYD